MLRAFKKKEEKPEVWEKADYFFMHHNPQKPFHAKSSFCTRARFKSSHRCAQIGCVEWGLHGYKEIYME